MSVEKKYLLASSRMWAIDAFLRNRADFSGQWAVITTATDLSSAAQSQKPRFTFFPHWSFIVPDAILAATECVCFHMADVPYGRGGSPLQNLICRGHKETVLTALKMTDELDAGPVYFKRALSLEGTAEQIFARAAELTMEMIGEIVRDEPTPTPQTGEATFFQRRKPEQSLVPPEADLAGLYDHIRMLDAEGYPHAFIDHGCWRAHFTGAKIAGDAVEARVRFEIKNKKKP